MLWYSTFLVRRPYFMVMSISVLCLACIIVSLTTKKLPDFSEPTLGFEARGTVIGKRLTAWENLLQETSSLFGNPNDLLAYQKYTMQETNAATARNHKFRRNHKRKDKKRKRKNHNKDYSKKIHGIKNRLYEDGNKIISVLSPSEWNGDNGVFRDYEITNESVAVFDQSNGSRNFEYGRNLSFVDEEDNQAKIKTKTTTWRLLKQANSAAIAAGNEQIHMTADSYFCDSPDKGYSHFVVERIGPNATDSLFDLNGLLAMCQLQEQLTSVTGYSEYCQKDSMLLENCCRPWSLPNYVALLSNKSSCFDLIHEDVIAVQNLLIGCFEYFHTLKLSNDCNEHMHCFAPTECKRHNGVFNMLHYLSDLNFIKTNDSSVYLKYAMIFLPVAQSTKILPLFHEWEKVDLRNEIVRVAAMDLGLENELFNECLITDGWLVALGGIFVMTCIWLYTTSVFVTLMTCIAVVFSLGLAYFIYTLVFEMSFFPFMNLLAVVVILGIGADDSFIFVKMWQCILAERFTKSTPIAMSAMDTENTETLQNLMGLTLRHAALSMFVTSLTTAVAFYASYVSSITSIKCFGIFAGTTVLTNYLLMITWLPASVAIMERFSTCNTCGKLHTLNLVIKLKRCINKLSIKFDGVIVVAVMKYSAACVILFALTGICAAIVVLYKPGLQLPDNAYFQLFASDHPFEMYESKLKHQFWFEKSMSTFENFKLPLRFVWGIQPVDDGDYDNPYSHGRLHYDNNFNISTKAAQIWLLDFCQRIKQQPFYQLTLGLLLPNCFIENFISYMNRLCIDNMDETDRTPCCDVSSFPYEPHIFDLCLPQSISSLYDTPREIFLPGVAGPKFFASNAYNEKEFILREQQQLPENITVSKPPLVKALVIEFESNVSYAASYNDVKDFVETVEQWLGEQLATAPFEMQGGWFTSGLKFFDVQDTLSRGTIIAIALAMTSSLVVLLAVTLNVLISLFAVVTVTLTILTTVAILILLGWKLNILESVAVSTAIGLAVDFSLHYSIHYRLSPTSERIAATKFSLNRIVGPTAMTALTTILAGTLMLFSNVLPYIQIGVFLVVVTSVSWIYATFFLMSLLKLAGPQYDFMQFNLPKFSKRPNTNGIKYYDRKESKIIASEQLLTPSSSAVVELITSELHELDSLTPNSIIKTISGNECLNASPMSQENSFPNNRHEQPRHSSNYSKCIESKQPFINYQSPSTESAITLELPVDDAENVQ